MKEKVGSVYSIAQDNPWVTSCTVSKEVMSQVSYYSLAENTDISAEIYPYYKLIYVHTGRAIVYTNDDEKTVNVGEAIIAHINIPVGIKTDQGTIYTEIMIGENSMMNSAVKPGEVIWIKGFSTISRDGKNRKHGCYTQRKDEVCCDGIRCRNRLNSETRSTRRST